MQGFSFGFSHTHRQEQRHTQRHEQRHEQRHILDVSGGITQSVFTKVEEFLEESEHQMALQWVAPKKKMGAYRSAIDFLFCEVFLEYQGHCKAFYEGNGVRLKDMSTQAEIDQWEAVLLRVLRAARTAYEVKRRVDWGTFRSEVLGLAA